jgi:anti-sigma regulatory factor (Ser/Thr protein kinase)
MMTAQTRQFNARLEPFSAVREFVERFCAGAGLPKETCEDLILILDELSTNTVQHGYPSMEGCAADWPIWLALSIAGTNVAVCYEDAAPAHNPFEKIVPPDYSGPEENWRIGGWGIPLIARLAGDLRYERAGDRNQTRFTLPIDRAVA